MRLLTPNFVLLIISGFFAMSGFASTLPLVPRYVENELGGSKVSVGLAVGIFSISAVLVRIVSSPSQSLPPVHLTINQRQN